jgi:hypothetical protein
MIECVSLEHGNGEDVTYVVEGVNADAEAMDADLAGSSRGVE